MTLGEGERSEHGGKHMENIEGIEGYMVNEIGTRLHRNCNIHT